MLKWVQEFKEAIYNSVRNLPEEISLSFSGGIDSSMILFTMIDLGRPPKELITFEIEGEHSVDLEYAKKISKWYQIPLKVATIPNTPDRDVLLSEVKEIIKTTRTTRNIETQVCYAYSYMIPLITTKHLITGFYEDIMFATNANISSKYSKHLKGLISKEDFDEEYRQIRKEVFEGKYRSGTEHNYLVIMRYLNNNGINVECPYKTDQIYNLFQNLTFKQTNYNPNTNKKHKKWFITEETHKDFFDLFSNHKNINNMHTTGTDGGLKGLHRRVLLAGTSYKDTRSVYNQILKDIEFEERSMFNVKL